MSDNDFGSMQNSKICSLRNACLLDFLVGFSCVVFLCRFLVGFRIQQHGQHHIVRSCFFRNSRIPANVNPSFPVSYSVLYAPIFFKKSMSLIPIHGWVGCRLASVCRYWCSDSLSISRSNSNPIRMRPSCEWRSCSASANIRLTSASVQR